MQKVQMQTMEELFGTSDTRKQFERPSHVCEHSTRYSFPRTVQYIQEVTSAKTTPNVGLEPTTLRLRVSCSTDWASRALMESVEVYVYTTKASFLETILICLKLEQTGAFCFLIFSVRSRLVAPARWSRGMILA